METTRQPIGLGFRPHGLPPLSSDEDCRLEHHHRHRVLTRVMS
jgi:hypothetical protein